MKNKKIRKFQKRLEKLFLEIKDIPVKEKVRIKKVVVGKLTKKAVGITLAREEKVVISSRVLKHIYERRPKDIEIVIEKIPLAICIPDEILFNIKTSGTVFFVKNHTKLFATLVEINVRKRKNEIITAFLTSRRYLKKFGRPGRSDVPPSTTKTWSASDQKISALQATNKILTKKQSDVKLSISIIIPNYNGEHLLKKNLSRVINETLRQGNKVTMEIIVVDDASTDRSTEIIKKFIKKYSYQFVRRPEKPVSKKAERGRPIRLNSRRPTMRLIKNRTNVGFASTVNRGVNEAQGEIIVLLNTDVYPEERFLEDVLPHFKDPKVFAVGMMDKSIEGSKIVRRGRGIIEWRRGMYIHRRGEVNKTNTDWVAGGSGAFRKSIWEKLGGFDEIYNPFYWEDIDLSFRAKKAGYKILFEPRSVVVHEHGKGIIKSNYNSRYIKTISYRNQFLFVWKNASLAQFFCHLLWLPYYFIKSILTGDICFIIGLLCAVKRKLKFKR